MPSPGNEFLSDEFGDIEDYFISDYWLIDQYIGDQLWVWGSGSNNSYGRIGDGNSVDRSTPVTTFSGGANWKQVSTTSVHTAAVKTDGTLWTWGINFNGQLGNNTTSASATPITTFAGGNDWKQVSVGQRTTMAIKSDNTLWVWGENSNGKLGINISSYTTRPTPVTTFAGGNDWKKIISDDASIALKTDGSLWVWGRNGSGKLGINDSNSNAYKPTPVTTFAGGNDWKDIFMGNQAAAIKTDGSLWVWGTNYNGGLGINQGNVSRPTPVTTFAGGNDWKSVAMGAYSTAAIKADGSLWVWGLNNNIGFANNLLGVGYVSSIGSNNEACISTPVTTFAGGNNWKTLLTTQSAIKTDGSLWVWGVNSVNLGTNASNDCLTPVTTFLGGNNWKTGNGQAAITAGLTVDFT